MMIAEFLAAAQRSSHFLSFCRQTNVKSKFFFKLSNVNVPWNLSPLSKSYNTNISVLIIFERGHVLS